MCLIFDANSVVSSLLSACFSRSQLADKGAAMPQNQQKLKADLAATREEMKKLQDVRPVVETVCKFVCNYVCSDRSRLCLRGTHILLLLLLSVSPVLFFIGWRVTCCRYVIHLFWTMSQHWALQSSIEGSAVHISAVRLLA